MQHGMGAPLPPQVPVGHPVGLPHDPQAPAPAPPQAPAAVPAHHPQAPASAVPAHHPQAPAAAVSAHHPQAPAPGAPAHHPQAPASAVPAHHPQAPAHGPHPPVPPPPGHHPYPPPGAAPAPGTHGAPAGWSGGPATGHVVLPPPVAGTGAATIAVLLIGPAGAGKTTVARHWAARRPVPTAHISLDDVREWVCSGFADPQSGWNENSEAQYRLARRTCGFAARNFLANGISCILDDAVFPDWPVVGLGGWKRHVGPGLLPVVLLPGLDVVLERNAERSGNRRLSDEEVAAIHGRMAGWYGSGLPIIDNSSYDVETTARVLDDVLARAISGQPLG
ncbi:AAA family ATPase [Streptomyces sp. NPDC101160]|uniref:AAA family ATPase n=1 Tax=Streptomyces sp. NPDC101160 TaxID=3366118 RepID=UPI003818F844